MAENRGRESLRIDFGSLWERFSADSSLKVEEVTASDGVTPNQIVRIPKGMLSVNAGDTGGGKDGPYVGVRCLARHFVRKPIYTIVVSNGAGENVLKTTADHTCMRIAVDEDGLPVDDDGRFRVERVSASEIREGDLMCTCEPETFFGRTFYDMSKAVTSVSTDENAEGTWVYDLETDSERHMYFANGVLVHNSQFINLSPITDMMCREAGLPSDTSFSALSEEVRERVVKEAYHIVDLANANVERLVNAECHTKHGDILHYSLEYVAAEGMYFKKKHYIVHEIIVDDLPCDKFKYSGISVKKAEIPASMKDFLRNIFESTMTRRWTEADYRKEVEKAFNTFMGLDWADISYWKKYRTPKRTISLTESEKGTQVHARAANFYNQLLEKLGLAGRYPKIGIGDEFRYSWILPTNEYGMNCIAFKGQFPDEFRSIFKPDYETMFEKIFTDSLKNYVRIMGYKTADPTRREENPEFSIF